MPSNIRVSPCSSLLPKGNELPVVRTTRFLSTEIEMDSWFYMSWGHYQFIIAPYVKLALPLPVSNLQFRYRSHCSNILTGLTLSFSATPQSYVSLLTVNLRIVLKDSKAALSPWVWWPSKGITQPHILILFMFLSSSPYFTCNTVDLLNE